MPDYFEEHGRSRGQCRSYRGHIDAILLSHDQHHDNLCHAGRALLTQAGSIITRPFGSRRLGSNTLGLKPWQSTSIYAPDGRTAQITATPARHGPPGIEVVSDEMIDAECIPHFRTFP
jgi:hypothetical protein